MERYFQSATPIEGMIKTNGKILVLPSIGRIKRKEIVRWLGLHRRSWRGRSRSIGCHRRCHFWLRALRRGVEVQNMVTSFTYNQIAFSFQVVFASMVWTGRKTEFIFDGSGAQSHTKVVLVAAQIKIESKGIWSEAGKCFHPVLFVYLQEVADKRFFVNCNHILVWVWSFRHLLFISFNLILRKNAAHQKWTAGKKPLMAIHHSNVAMLFQRWHSLSFVTYIITQIFEMCKFQSIKTFYDI